MKDKNIAFLGITKVSGDSAQYEEMIKRCMQEHNITFPGIISDRKNDISAKYSVWGIPILSLSAPTGKSWLWE